MRLRKVLKNRGHLPSGEATTKLIYLALRNITKSWKNPTADVKDGSQPIRDSIRGEI
jgi:hypothetical protein